MQHIPWHRRPMCRVVHLLRWARLLVMRWLLLLRRMPLRCVVLHRGRLWAAVLLIRRA